MVSIWRSQPTGRIDNSPRVDLMLGGVSAKVRDGFFEILGETFTAVNAGDVDVAANWSPAGVPGVYDKAIITGFVMTVPSGYVFSPGEIAFTGSSDSARAGLTISAGGIFRQAGNAAFNDFNRVTVAGEWDLNGFDANYTVSSGSDINNWIESSGAAWKIWSSSTLGSIQKNDGSAVYGRLFLQSGFLSNIKFHFGGGYYSGGYVRVKKNVFYNMGHIQTGQYTYAGDDWYFEENDFDGCLSPVGSECAIFACQLDFSGDPLTGIKAFKKNTFRYSNVSGAIVKFSDNTTFEPDYNYFDKVEVSNFNGTTNWRHIFSSANSFGGLNYITIFDSYISPKTDNPHTMPPPSQNLDGVIIEAIYPAGSTDGGDHFITGNLGNSVKNSIIIDGWGGALINALGADMSGNYSLEHCTVVADVNDAAYGIMARNESGGKFIGTLSLRSNIVRARSNPSGVTNIRAVNMETAGIDQVTTMGHNCISGLGSVISTLFYNVTGTGKTYGDSGFGGGDQIGVNPNFYDENRGILSWGATVGAANYQASVDALLNGVNGYDPSTHQQSAGLVTGNNVVSLLDHVRYGFRPANIALKDAGHDGVTIGAQPWIPLSAAYSYTGTSGLFSGGSAIIARAKAFVASGGVTLSGAASRIRGKSYFGLGGLSAGGSSGTSKNKSPVVAGGLQVGGSAITSGAGIKQYVGAGGLFSGGAANCSFFAAGTSFSRASNDRKMLIESENRCLKISSENRLYKIGA